MTEAATSLAPEKRPWARATLWLLFLGPFFFASYGFATWVSGTRARVGSIVFEWERAIPFVAWTIVPYWAIDLFYGLSLFACVNRRELDTHARRLLTAQVIAVSMFLVFPLRFSFDRPEVGGGFGWMFDFLANFDKPFNQAPSLHIALLVIIWALFATRTTGIRRLVLDIAFAIIGVSVLTTWQHHFIDIPTGVLLGFLCLWLWPREGPSPLEVAHWTRDRRRLQLALCYTIAATAVAALALSLGGWALWLLWVTTSLALVAANYALVGPAGFQKRDGRLSPAAWVLLAPYLLGAWVNVWAWTRKRRSPDHIADDVWIGRIPTRAELDCGGFEVVIDLTCELPLDHGSRIYENPAVLDLTLPDRPMLLRAVQSIEGRHAQGRTLVCCALGYSRSATVVAAWLTATGRASNADSAIARIRAHRPEIVLTDAHRALIVA